MNIDGLIEDYGDLPGPEESLDFELYEALRMLHQLDQDGADQIVLPCRSAAPASGIFSDPML